MEYVALMEDNVGNQHSEIIEADSLEDATIEGDNLADEMGWEMLQIDTYNVI